ncbi:MAG: NAD(+)/NADH kinase [Christensenellaceae bacterium]|jgi:NAD+ kinase
MARYGIYANLTKDKDLSYTKQVISALQAKGLLYFLDEELFGQLPGALLTAETEIDVLIVLGGDGTMLAAARKYGKSGALLFGLNLGRLGFLLDSDIAELSESLACIEAGAYEVQERVMLEAQIISEAEEVVFSGYALNEAVVSQRNMMRVIDLEAYVDGEYAYRIRSDGLIVSTPSGSTAYSLSAGGPVVFPTVDVLLMTPLCAHSLQSNTFVIPGEAEVVIRPVARVRGAALTLDGQDSIEMASSSYVKIQKTPFKVKFLKTTTKSFYTLLQEKLSEWR